MIPEIEAVIEIEAPPARAWRALIEPDLVESWLGALGYFPKLGRVFYMQPDAKKRDAGDIEGATHCQIDVLEPQRRLRFSWYYPETPKTYVTLTLTPIPGGTHVALVHAGWEPFGPDVRPIRDALADGWSGNALPQLKALVESLPA